MLELAYPWMLLALPAPLLVWWLLPPCRRRVSALRVPFFHQLVQVTGVEARVGAVVVSRKVSQMLVMTLVWTLLVIGLARPEWVGEPIVRTESARDIMLAIDLSGSMDYVDFIDEHGAAVQRLEAVKRVVDRFVATRQTDRIGLIVFGSRAFLQLPFTRDVATARSLVESMEVAMAGPQTALGDAIGLAIHSFLSTEEASAAKDRLLILLTDGSDTASNMTPINAAEIARLNAVEIFTIGVGDPKATGEDRVDFDTLQIVAQRTGGQFFTAKDESALNAVYRRIDTMAPGEVTTQVWRPRQSLVFWPAGIILLVGLISGVLLILSVHLKGARP